jgi:hypothetical protein
LTTPQLTVKLVQNATGPLNILIKKRSWGKQTFIYVH